MIITCVHMQTETIAETYQDFVPSSGYEGVTTRVKCNVIDAEI